MALTSEQPTVSRTRAAAGVVDRVGEAGRDGVGIGEHASRFGTVGTTCGPPPLLPYSPNLPKSFSKDGQPLGCGWPCGGSQAACS